VSQFRATGIEDPYRCEAICCLVDDRPLAEIGKEITDWRAVRLRRMLCCERDEDVVFLREGIIERGRDRFRSDTLCAGIHKESSSR
jgi:hypothetical protein